MPRFEVFRINGSKPGCVDFLGEIEAESEQSCEYVARLMYDFDWAAGDRVDIWKISASDGRDDRK